MAKNQKSTQSVPQEIKEHSLDHSTKRYQNWIDQAYEDFQKTEEYKDLPGKGKPLKLNDEDALSSVLRNANYKPGWVGMQDKIRQEIAAAIKLKNTPAAEHAFENAISEINKLIAKYNTEVPSPQLQRTRIFPDIIEKQYEEKWAKE